jgi:hypothetical protein
MKDEEHFKDSESAYHNRYAQGLKREVLVS